MPHLAQASRKAIVGASKAALTPFVNVCTFGQLFASYDDAPGARAHRPTTAALLLLATGGRLGYRDDRATHERAGRGDVGLAEASRWSNTP